MTRANKTTDLRHQLLLQLRPHRLGPPVRDLPALDPLARHRAHDLDDLDVQLCHRARDAADAVCHHLRHVSLLRGLLSAGAGVCVFWGAGDAGEDAGGYGFGVWG